VEKNTLGRRLVDPGPLALATSAPPLSHVTTHHYQFHCNSSSAATR